MLAPNPKALLPGALLALVLGASAASGKDLYKGSLDPGIPHHAAILDTLARIEKTPGDAQLHNDLGCLVAWDGFWRDALRSFDKAAELAPKDSRPWFNAGLVEALRGEWGNARSRFRKAVKVDPGNWPAWWMLGYSEESLGHDDAAAAAYSQSLRVDTSLFDPKTNPFAVSTRLKARVLLETYDRRRVDAALPFANQLEDPSRVSRFFQSRVKKPEAPAAAEEAARTGPVVTTVPPPGTVVRPTPVPTEPIGRRRRAYDRGRERDGTVDVAPERPRGVPQETSPTPVPPPPGPGFGEGSGAPGSGAQQAQQPPAAPASPGFGGPRRVPTPVPTPEEE